VAEVKGSVLDLSPVIPVVVLDDPEFAAPLARALLAGGIGVVELTLRTPSALECVRRIAAEVPDVVLGVGTVLNPADLGAAVTAGADFLVSPGCTSAVYDAAAEVDVPLLPGVQTTSEVMAAFDRGYTELKFFPAEQAGGPALLSAWSSPLPQARFCPTGGITPDLAGDYLRLPNVGCVGGSWLTPRNAVAARDAGAVEELARAAVSRLSTSV
jgi:2-dehydro-3-deoxyphosphogluconate aldolase/(4S)-4-hydroxy-2-oxoglutarate aldolase